MKDKICKEGRLFERLKTIKFQGKPPKIKLLKNSTLPNKIEKIIRLIIIINLRPFDIFLDEILVISLRRK